MKIIVKKAACRISAVMEDESGKMEALTWTLGATVVTVLVVVLLMRIMPETTQSFWNAATQWIRTSFGF